MAWPVTRANGLVITAAVWNEVVNALSGWGGNVNAGGFNLSNVNALTGVSATFSGAVSAGSISTPTVISTTSLRGPSVQAIGSDADVRVGVSVGGVGFRLVYVAGGSMHMQRSVNGFATLDNTPTIYNADSSVAFPNNVSIGRNTAVAPLTVKVGTNQNISIQTDSGVARIIATNDAADNLVAMRFAAASYLFQSGVVTFGMRINLGSQTTYANDGAASSLSAGQVYWTSSGELRIKL